MSEQKSSEQSKTKTRDLFDSVAWDYDQTGVAYFKPVAETLVQLAGVKPGHRVLDVGSGRGAVTFAAAKACAPDGTVTAFDLSPSMISLLDAEVANAGLADRVSVAVADAEDPGFPERSFDRVLSGLVLFFVPDPVAAMTQAHRNLADGGTFAFSSFGQQDPAFQAALKALASFTPSADGVRGPGGEGPDPFATLEGIRAMTAEAGFGRTQIMATPFTSRFASIEKWIEFAWSVGLRALLELIPAEDLPAAYAAVAEAFAPATDATGAISVKTEFRFTICR